MIHEPEPGSICRDRLGQAWSSRTTQPFGWQRANGGGIITEWEKIPRDLRETFVLLGPAPPTMTWQFSGTPEVAVFIDGTVYLVARDEPVWHWPARDRAIARALLQLALDRMDESILRPTPLPT